MENENLEENASDVSESDKNNQVLLEDTETEINSNEGEVENTKNLFTIKDMLEAGVHFGHRTMRWNAKMAPYIYGSRNNIHIIDLTQTAILMNESMRILKELVKKRGRVLFVCTKKQGSESVKKLAEDNNQFYVTHKWLGGMLTNWKTVSQSIKIFRLFICSNIDVCDSHNFMCFCTISAYSSELSNLFISVNV